MNHDRKCVYVTRGWGVHDERWTSALQGNGFTPLIQSVGHSDLALSELKSGLDSSTYPVIAGPLEVTKGLLGIPRRLFGLSWGFDLVLAHERGEDLSWMKQLTGLIVDSRHTREVAQAAGVSSSRILTIPWGVDLEMFTPTGEKTDLSLYGVPYGRKIVMSLRRLEPIYRVDDIIHAFSCISDEISNVHLVIGNDGSRRIQLEALASRLGIAERISFIGEFPEASLPGLLRAAHAYVTASSVDGSSVTLLEAMACRIPVIASDTPGNSEWVIPGRTGYLFPVATPSELASAITHVLDESASGEPARRARQARELIEVSADWSRNCKKISAALLTLS